jgi:phospholipid/cholesterol/gamma-HCH transport system substrate-binding protein
MEKSNPGLKVGAFALAALLLLAYIILSFAKSTTPWTSQTRITVESTEVGGLVAGAKVMMSGVQVGHVESLDLTADGKKVAVNCSILKRYRIRRDAKFEIQQSGFLGDQYVSIIPTRNEGDFLKDGEIVEAVAPFNMLEAARSAAGLLQRLDTTAAKLDAAITRVDRILLAEGALRDITNGIASFRSMAARADTTLGEVQSMVLTNAPGVGMTLSNLNAFTLSLRSIATEVGGVVEANRGSLHTTMSNLSDASADVKAFTAGLRSGQGLIAAALQDPGMRERFGMVMTNMATLSSNLSRSGIFWKPKTLTPLTNSTRGPARQIMP